MPDAPDMMSVHTTHNMKEVLTQIVCSCGTGVQIEGCESKKCEKCGKTWKVALTIMVDGREARRWTPPNKREKRKELA